MLTTFCSQNELRINNTVYQHKWQHKYTFFNSRNQRSLIEYIITKKKTHPSQIMDVRTLASTNVSTEHGLVLCKYRLYVQLRKKSPTALISRMNVESLEAESTLLLYQNRLTERISNNSIKKEDNPDQALEKIRTNIIDSITKAVESEGK